MACWNFSSIASKHIVVRSVNKWEYEENMRFHKNHLRSNLINFPQINSIWFIYAPRKYIILKTEKVRVRFANEWMKAKIVRLIIIEFSPRWKIVHSISYYVYVYNNIFWGTERTRNWMEQKWNMRRREKSLFQMNTQFSSIHFFVFVLILPFNHFLFM